MTLTPLDARQPWLLPFLLTLAASLMLGTAWISELYGEYLRFFGNQNLAPCPLCLVQRYPYVAIIALGSLAVLFSNQPMTRAILLSIIAMALIFGSYVSGFHIGVEYGWWTAGSACSAPIAPLEFTDTITIRAQPLDMRPPPSCSDAAWRFPGENGLSMATYNFLISSGMAIIATILSLASLNRLPKELR